MLALLAAAAISSASAIDVSARCVAELQGGLPAFSVTASPTGPKLAARFRVPAQNIVLVNQPKSSAGIGKYFPQSALREQLLP